MDQVVAFHSRSTVFRSIRQDEEEILETQGLKAKNSDCEKRPSLNDEVVKSFVNHVVHGSKKDFFVAKSPWISTTTDFDVARKFALPLGKIARVNLSNEIYFALDTESGRNAFVVRAKEINAFSDESEVEKLLRYSERSLEILIYHSVCPSSVKMVPLKVSTVRRWSNWLDEFPEELSHVKTIGRWGGANEGILKFEWQGKHFLVRRAKPNDESIMLTQAVLKKQLLFSFVAQQLFDTFSSGEEAMTYKSCLYELVDKTEGTAPFTFFAVVYEDFSNANKIDPMKVEDEANIASIKKGLLGSILLGNWNWPAELFEENKRIRRAIFEKPFGIYLEDDKTDVDKEKRFCIWGESVEEFSKFSAMYPHLFDFSFDIPQTFFSVLEKWEKEFEELVQFDIRRTLNARMDDIRQRLEAQPYPEANTVSFII